MGLCEIQARRATPVVLLLCATATLSFLIVMQTPGAVFSKHQPVSGHLTRGESYSRPQSNKLQRVVADDENSSGTKQTGTTRRKMTMAMKRAEASDFEHSEIFKQFVAQQTGRYASVAEYLDSTRAYLFSFVSPMIIETSNEYNWTETEEETRQRLSRSKNGRPTVKTIVWYNANLPRRIHSNPSRFERCEVSDCEMFMSYENHSTADAVVFHQVPLGEHDVPPRKHDDQIYVFQIMDPPSNKFSGFRKKPWNSAFNWTWTYRLDADLFTPVAFLRRAPSPPSHSHLLRIMRRKTKMIAWFVSHCDTQSLREKYVERLQKIVPVDIYGACGPLQCRRKSEECLHMLNDYFFYLSFENSYCQDYVTEKYYRTFYKGIKVLSVVRGGANYSRFFPEGTFIDADWFTGPEELGQYLLALASDRARYVDLLWRRSHFVRHEHGNADANCKLCYKLHHLDRFKKTYTDLYAWNHLDKCRDPKPFR